MSCFFKTCRWPAPGRTPACAFALQVAHLVRIETDKMFYNRKVAEAEAASLKPPLRVSHGVAAAAALAGGGGGGSDGGRLSAAAGTSTYSSSSGNVPN